MKSNQVAWAAFVLAAFSGMIESPTQAETSVSPYIDSLRAKMKDEGTLPADQPTAEVPDPYIQSLRKKLQEKDGVQAETGTQPYIDSLREKDASLNPKSESVGSYTENMKNSLGPSQVDGGAIQAVAEGKSGLKMKRPGQVKAAFGFKVGTAVNRSYTGSSQFIANSYSDIYGTGWVPDFTLSAEYKPYYSETYGSLGIVFSGGFSFVKGSGRFAIPLTQPNGSSFPSSSRTKLTFISVPASITAKYQFNLSHIIRPYAQVGPTLVGFTENRSDGIGAKRGLSKGLTTNAGVAILLDGLVNSNSWDLYQDFSIKHFYLTVEYEKLTTISSNIDISYSGAVAGFNFEF